MEQKRPENFSVYDRPRGWKLLLAQTANRGFAATMKISARQGEKNHWNILNERIIFFVENYVAWPSWKELAMGKLDWKIEASVDVINLALGGFLFLSPWIFGFTSDLGWHTSWMAGTAIVIIAIFSIGDLLGSVSIFFETEEWLNLAIGLWVAACHWILGFHDDMMAMQVHTAVGLVIAAIAVVELWVMHRAPPHGRA